MKTLLKFWRNQSNNIFRALIVALFSLSPLAQAAELDQILSKLLEINKKNIDKFQYTDLTLSKCHQLKTDKYDYAINKEHLLSIFLNSTESLNQLLIKNNCRFIEMINSKLILNKKNDYLMVDQVDMQTGKSTLLKADPSLIAKYLFNEKCPKSMPKIFTRLDMENFLESELLENPRSDSACTAQFSRFIAHPKVLSYLKFYRDLAKNKKLRSKFLPRYQSQYLKLKANSDHIFKAKKLCLSSKGQTAFDPKIYNLLKNNFFNPLCRKTYKEDTKRLKCVKNFSSLNKVCHEALGSKSKLYPHQSCQELTDLLRNSPPKSRVDELNIEGESLGFAFKFFKSINKSKVSQFSDFLDFLEKEGELKLYKTRICYTHKFLNSKMCKKTFYQESQHYLSINNQVESALKKQKIIPRSVKCVFQKEIVSPLPTRTNGCLISTKNNNCYINDCEIQVRVNNKLIPNFFTQETDHFFKFYNYNNDNTFQDFISIIKRKYKLKERRVNNTTTLKGLLKNDSLVFGSSCLEDLLPLRFDRLSISQCTPIPFQVISMTRDKIILQLSIERNFFRREYRWSALKESIQKFSKYTEKKWSLYALEN